MSKAVRVMVMVSVVILIVLLWLPILFVLSLMSTASATVRDRLGEWDDN